MDNLYWIVIGLVVFLLIGKLFGGYHYDTPASKKYKDEL